MNTQKYETYKSIHESLSKALKYGFYYEAIFLEYAIVEDRLASVLKYAGIPYIDKNGQDVSISKKLNLIESRKELLDKFYRDWIGFGGGCINDTLIHLATSEMPFGGFGESGMGSYHGKTGFDTFTHYKSIVDKKTWLDLPMRYQPYKKINNKFLHMFLK